MRLLEQLKFKRVIEMKLNITIYIEGEEIKVPHGESYEITCKKGSTASIMLGD